MSRSSGNAMVDALRRGDGEPSHGEREEDAPRLTDAELRASVLDLLKRAMRLLDAAGDHLAVIVHRASEDDADHAEAFARHIDYARDEIRSAQRWDLP